ETSLNRAEFRWKWLQFLRQTSVLGVLICLAVLFFGGAILAGWITSQKVAVTFLALLGVFGFVAWAILAISIMAGSPNRSWLANAIERVDPRFLDRLNTLLFLETRRGERGLDSFAVRIAKQTQGLLAERPVPSAFSAERALRSVLLFLVSLILTVAFYQAY